jgi:hypothetical protein
MRSWTFNAAKINKIPTAMNAALMPDEWNRDLVLTAKI